MSDSLSHTQLKKRLLGAGILVLVAAMFVPFFIGEPKQSLEQAEPDENAAFQSRIQPLEMPAETLVEDQLMPLEVDDSGQVLKKLPPLQADNQEAPVAAPAKPVDIQPLRRDGSAVPLPDKKVQKPVAKAPAKKTQPKQAVPKKTAKQADKQPVKKQVAPTKVASAPGKKASSIRSGWAVQAGVFSKPANAEASAKSLRSKGLRPQITNTKTSAGRAKRVWLGPYATKSEARAVSKRLEQQTGNGGYVAPYPFKS